MPILITGAATAGAHRVHRALGLSDVIFGDAEELPSMLFKTTKFIRIPSGASVSFAHQLLTLCLDHSIEMVFPLRKNEVLALAETKTLFEEYNIQLIVPHMDDAVRLLGSASAEGDEFVVARDAMLLTGQLLEQGELPAETGLFICSAENYSELKLFIVD